MTKGDAAATAEAVRNTWLVWDSTSNGQPGFKAQWRDCHSLRCVSEKDYLAEVWACAESVHLVGHAWNVSKGYIGEYRRRKDALVNERRVYDHVDASRGLTLSFASAQRKWYVGTPNLIGNPNGFVNCYGMKALTPEALVSHGVHWKAPPDPASPRPEGATQPWINSPSLQCLSTVALEAALMATTPTLHLWIEASVDPWTDEPEDGVPDWFLTVQCQPTRINGRPWYTDLHEERDGYDDALWCVPDLGCWILAKRHFVGLTLEGIQNQTTVDIDGSLCTFDGALVAHCISKSAIWYDLMDITREGDYVWRPCDDANTEQLRLYTDAELEGDSEAQRAQINDLEYVKSADLRSAEAKAEAAAQSLLADEALEQAVATADLEGLRAAIEEHQASASASALANARQVRDGIKKKAKKKAAKKKGPMTEEAREEDVVDKAAGASEAGRSALAATMQGAEETEAQELEAADVGDATGAVVDAEALADEASISIGAAVASLAPTDGVAQPLDGVYLGAPRGSYRGVPRGGRGGRGRARRGTGTVHLPPTTGPIAMAPPAPAYGTAHHDLPPAVPTAATEQAVLGQPESPRRSAFNECVICCDRLRTYAMVPCGHLCVCTECYDQFFPRDCPICRAPFQSALRVQGFS